MSVIELQKESMKFSAGHTTIFSKTDREPLHGHTYNVYLALTTEVGENGLMFDYRFYKQRIHQLCRELNQIFLMPMHSPYMTYREEGEYYYFLFNGKEMPFLKEDVKLLPVRNITVEELSKWMVDALAEDKEELEKNKITNVTVKVFSAPGQSGSYCWSKE
jgi:6-pyruvoyltetrahydropterin/6-carboxytetrahydropterin synthase